MLGPYSPSHNPMGLMPHTTHPFLPYAQWAPGTHSVLPGEPSLGGGEQGMVRSEGLEGDRVWVSMAKGHRNPLPAPGMRQGVHSIPTLTQPLTPQARYGHYPSLTCPPGNSLGSLILAQSIPHPYNHPFNHSFHSFLLHHHVPPVRSTRSLHSLPLITFTPSTTRLSHAGSTG